MSVIDISVARASRDKPDSDCVRRDDDGRELGLYALSYSMGRSTWSLEVWAYSMEDADNRVAAIRESLTLLGQVHSIIPA